MTFTEDEISISSFPAARKGYHSIFEPDRLPHKGAFTEISMDVIPTGSCAVDAYTHTVFPNITAVMRTIKSGNAAMCLIFITHLLKIFRRTGSRYPLSGLYHLHPSAHKRKKNGAVPIYARQPHNIKRTPLNLLAFPAREVFVYRTVSYHRGIGRI